MCSGKSYGGLGFRDIHDFNLALLGKQIWRVVTCPNSLAARVFKVRYYHDCPVLEAKLGNNPIYLWRILLAAQQLVKEGVVWRVGNGTQARIWKDPEEGIDDLCVDQLRRMG